MPTSVALWARRREDWICQVSVRLRAWITTGSLYTSVALWALRRLKDVCHVSMRLFASTCRGRCLIRALLRWGVSSDVRQVSTRLCPMIWIGLWIYISSSYIYQLYKNHTYLIYTLRSSWYCCPLPRVNTTFALNLNRAVHQPRTIVRNRRLIFLPCINATFRIHLNRMMNKTSFCSSRNVIWYSPSINTTLANDMNWFMNLERGTSWIVFDDSIYYFCSIMSSLLWRECLPCIDSTSSINLGGTVNDILFSRAQWLLSCSPSIDATLSKNTNWFPSLEGEVWWVLFHKWISYFSGTTSSSLWGECLPSINSTSSVDLNRTVNNILFTWREWFFRCSPRIHATLPNNMNRLMNLYGHRL